MSRSEPVPSPFPTGVAFSLHRAERFYLAIEGIAGSIAPVYVCRVKRPIPVQALREAMRGLIDRVPRLRSVVKRTWRRYKLRSIDHVPTLEALFDHAFRVQPGRFTNADEIRAAVDAMTNTSLALERDLPWRIRVFGDGECSWIALQIHHLASDGRGAIWTLDALLAAAIGGELPPVTIDPSGVSSVLWPTRLREWIGMFLEIFRRQPKGEGPLLALPTRALETFPPTGVILRAARAPSSDLRRAARKFGVSLTALLLGACAVAIGKVSGMPKARFRGRISIDLRPLFREVPRVGNFVVSSIADVSTDADVPGLLERIEKSTRASIDRFRERRAGLSFLFEALTQSLGRKFNGMVFSLAMRRRWAHRTSVHVSNLGGLELLDERGGLREVTEFYAMSQNPGLFITATGLADKLHFVFGYPRVEMDEHIGAFVEEFDRVLDDWARLARPSAPPRAPSDVQDERPRPNVVPAE